MRAWLCALMLASVASAETPLGFVLDRQVPTAQELGAHDAAFDNEGYVERWMLMVNRDDGGWMQLSFALTHAGPGSRHGVVDLMRLAPPLTGSPGDPATFYRWPIKQTSMVAAHSGISLAFDDNLLRETPSGFEVRVNEWGYELELTVDRGAGPFRPGSRPLSFENGGIVAVDLPAITARIRGRERTHGGEWRPIRGKGWLDHGLTTRLPHLLASRVLRFQGSVGPWGVATFELHSPRPRDSGGAQGPNAVQRAGFVVVTYNDAVVAVSVDARSAVANFRKDPSTPGRRVPKRWSLRFDTPDGPAELRVNTGKSLFREDVLEPMNPFIRAFLEPFFKPINDHDQARFELALPAALTARVGGGKPLKGIAAPAGPLHGKGVAVFTTVAP